LEAATLGIEGEVTEMDVGKVHFGAAVGVQAQPDAFAGEGFAEVVVAAFVREVTGDGDDLHFLVRGIHQRLVVFAQPPRAGVVKGRQSKGGERCTLSSGQASFRNGNGAQLERTAIEHATGELVNHRMPSTRLGCGVSRHRWS
jgi:hypothetical protein